MFRGSGLRLGVVAVVLGLVLAAGGGTIFVGSVSAQGSVLVDSDITSDTTWESGSGPYRVVKSIEVGPDATLTIQPGVTIEVAEDVNITVEGNIEVAGSPSQPVVFTSSKTDPTPGSWGSLVLSGPSSQATAIRHATLEYATNGIALEGSQRVFIESVEIAHAAAAGINGLGGDGFAPRGEIRVAQSDIHDNGFGILGADEKFIIRDSTIRQNARAGIKLSNVLDVVGLRIANTTIAGNDIGVNLESSVDEHNRGGRVDDIAITESQIQDNAGLGLRMFGDRVTDIHLANSEFSGNGGSGIHIQDSGLKGGSRASLNISFVSVTADDNGDRGAVIDAAYSNLEDVEIADSRFDANAATGLVVEADRSLSDVHFSIVEARDNGGSGIEVSADQTSSVSLSSVSIFANVADGVAIHGTNISTIEVADSTVTRNGDIGLVVNGSNPDHPTTITGATVAGNGDGIFIAEHAARVTESSIQHNDGIGIEFNDTGPETSQLSQSDLFGNGVALEVPRTADSLVADANGNYWGASSGPYHASINPEGEGDQVNGSLETVEFLDYANSPFGEVHERPTASLSVPTEPVHNGTAITISASESSDDGAIEWYRFQINDSTDTGMIQQSSITHTFEQPGTYQINLSVIDDDGVPSAEEAVLNLSVANSNQDSTGGEQTTTDGSNSGSNGGNGGNQNTTTIDAGVTVPGFGIGAALLALLGAALLARRGN